jgi:diguanylate cyclase (GGDEF)-like protein
VLGASADTAAIAACVLGAAAAARLVADRGLPVNRLSRLDAALGGSATGALAVALGAPAPAAVATAAIAGVVALARWRPGVAIVLVLVGLAALGAGEDTAGLAAPLIGAAAWLRIERAAPGPEFSPVVLTAILTFATIALMLLTVGQFTEVDDVAVALAIVTVLTGMARAGLTVVQRLRESRDQALTDELTGLGNRRHLVERLDAAIEESRENGSELALLLVDLDGFKELNDTLGHHAGDQVLRQIGPRLNGLLRADDTLARLGGDEFAVVLMPGDETSASAAGLRLRAALERSFEVGGIRVHIDASVGIALFPAHAEDALGLLQRADVAMYEAKRMRTGHEVYVAGRDRHSRERLALIGELHSALDAGELVLHYQPKAEIATGAVRSVEALVRWEHPRQGLLGPSHFLPLVEQSGLTRALTAFVLDRALLEIGTLREAGYDLRGGQPRAGRPAGPRAAARGRAAAQRPPLPGRLPPARGLRGRGDGRRRAHRGGAARPTPRGRAHGPGRLRGRPLRARPPAPPADRRAQGRPVVRDAAARGRARRGDRALGHRPRPSPRAHGRGGGRGERGGVGTPCDEAQGHLLGRPMSAIELGRWLVDLPDRERAAPPLWAAVRS